MKTLLESAGYQVYYAYQPEKGFELAKETLPELILLDVLFSGPPGPHGLQIARELHTDPKFREVPVIILSGVRKTRGISYLLLPNEKWMPVKGLSQNTRRAG